MDVSEILAEGQKKYATTEVHKDIEVSMDLGNLTLFDPAPIVKTPSNTELVAMTRDNMQLLSNAIFELPTKAVDVGLLAMLPEPTTLLPREKHIPLPKPPTRWEKFAATKGIHKRKRDRMEYDEETKEYKPIWGYGRSGANDDWVIPVTKNDDPMEDLFEKKANEKKTAKAKQQKNEARNELHAARLLPKNASLTSKDSRPDRKVLREALITTKVSTASLGKFDEALDHDPIKGPPNKRRKFDSTVRDVNEEKGKSIKIMERILNKEKILDADRAANQLQVREEREAQRRNLREAREAHKLSKAGGQYRKVPKRLQKKGGKSSGGDLSGGGDNDDDD